MQMQRSTSTYDPKISPDENFAPTTQQNKLVNIQTYTSFHLKELHTSSLTG